VAAAGGEGIGAVANVPASADRVTDAVGFGPGCAGGAAKGLVATRGSGEAGKSGGGKVPVPSRAELMRKGGSVSAAAEPVVSASKASSELVPNCPRCD